MSQSHSFPPPIHDKVSGKTYIAIPAPPFVCSGDTQPPSDDGSPQPDGRNAGDASGYVYVEKTIDKATIEDRSRKKRSHSGGKKAKFIGTWSENIDISESPPGHVPWESEVSSAFSNCATLDTSSDNSRFERPHSRRVNESSSASTFEIPSLDSDTLVNGSLPSDCSGGWSDGIASKPLGVEKRKTVAAPTRVQGGSTNTPKSRRKTMCVTDLNHRREAFFFSRRPSLTAEKIKAKPERGLHPSNSGGEKRTQAISMLCDMDDSFTNALGKIDQAMANLKEEKEKLGQPVEAPSLCVSTSQTQGEPDIDFATSTPTLAKRRGKRAPTSLTIQPTLMPKRGSDEYPDIPTPFQCSPAPGSDTFAPKSNPVYPTLVLDSRLTAEQMINSLRAQVENFVPRTPDESQALEDQCTEAEAWLNDELSGEHDKRELDSANGGIPSDKVAEKEQRQAERPISQFPSDSPGGNVNPTTTTITTQATPKTPRHYHSMPFTSTPKPRKSILSDGTTHGTSAHKKVRFSIERVETTIPPLLTIFEPPISESKEPIPPSQVERHLPKRKLSLPVASIKPPVNYDLKPAIGYPKKLQTPTTRISSPFNPTKLTTPENADARKSFRDTNTSPKKKFATISGNVSPLAPKSNNQYPMSAPTNANDKRYTLSKSPIPRRSPLIFTANANSPIAKDAPNESDRRRAGAIRLFETPNKLKQTKARPQSLQVPQMQTKGLGAGSKENQGLFGGIPVTRKRSFTMGSVGTGMKGKGIENIPVKTKGKVGKDVGGGTKGEKAGEGKGPRRSLPFQSVLNKLRG